MAAYDRTRQPPTRTLQERTRAALERFLLAIAAEDGAAIAGLLAPDVRALSDGGGEFHAARKPIVGAKKIALFYTRIGARRPVLRSEVRSLNGLPALVMELGGGLPREATCIAVALEVAPDGRISRIDTVLASRKLTAIALAAA